MRPLWSDVLQGVSDDLCGRRMSLMDFCVKYLRHHFPLPDSVLHKDLKARLEAIVKDRGALDNWRAPRGNAKSTILTLAYPLYCICFNLERYIILVSDTHTQAKQLLADIKTELENNEELKKDFPLACKKGEKWNDNEIITGNNIMLTALGMRGKIRGRKYGSWRPTLILIDDPENDESAVSKRQRERARTWLLNSCMKAGVPDHTNIIIVGTVINAECLVEYLAGKSEWRTRTYASIRVWPKNMDMWDKWEVKYYDDHSDKKDEAKAFYLINREKMDLDAQVLWPHRETIYSLMCLRAQDHLAFESEKQNSPLNPKECRFPGDWFDNIWFDELPDVLPGKPWLCYGFCDPSVGKDAKKGDFAPIVWVWWKKGYRFLYVDCSMARRPVPVTIDETLRLHMAHEFQAFGFEVNGFQSTMADELGKKSVERGITLPLVLVNHIDNKELRIEKLGAHLQMRNFKFKKHSEGAKALVKQLMTFGIKGVPDDGPDALEGCLNIITKSNVKR